MNSGAPAFERYVGIDYSGAETPNASLKGLRVYAAEGNALAAEVLPPPSPRKYWTRSGLAAWLVDRLAEGPPTIVGIDHGFSFPLRYFETHLIPPDWPTFLDDFQRHFARPKLMTHHWSRCYLVVSARRRPLGGFSGTIARMVLSSSCSSKHRSNAALYFCS